MTSFQTFLFALLSLCLSLSGSVLAFQPISQPQQSRASGTVRRFLHPDQAADLEACAYDLMKEALEESRLQTSSSGSLQIGMAEAGQSVNPNTMEASSIPGPVAWCRRRLWPFAKGTIQQQQQNLRP